MCFLVSVDTRNIFTSHLHAALLRKKIVTYIDYKLERGDEIGPALLEAIEKSKLTSIDPSDVRKQQGSYADAFAQLEERFKDSIDKVLNWNDALTKVASIWGMPGIGKTTLAGAVFNRLSTKFEACCFLANVREESESHGLNQLRNKLLRMLLEEENLNIETPSVGSNFVGERLACTKVLIVLDDVNNLNQLELLAGDQDQFGPRSRITITARDRVLLKERVDDENIHKIKRLCFDEALQLLHLNDFKGNSPATNYAELSKVVLDYADGNPLALKILGSSFLIARAKKIGKMNGTN
ncbi:PREDICTED: TMV resistance protein N-like [Prunus mume]|uniref:TMV resistance protein N-like n=1 Tax=Prunus mume TaxID=102107 RepID=A0ABM0PCD0_PRUMU|nr:PREDICTED: TMV resistance protein N-like [Prunus mume]